MAARISRSSWPFPPTLQFVGDRDDLIEALGNLMDNAAKWCRVAGAGVGALLQARRGAARSCTLVVEDDGPGMPAARPRSGCWSAARAPTSTRRDMASAWPWCATWPSLYGGRLHIGESPLGGARVELRLPGRLR